MEPDGSTRSLGSGDFAITPSGSWRSSRSGAAYPSRWTLEVPSVGLSIDIVPYVADQEMVVSIPYWEGAVRARGQRSGTRLTGSGYVELTGYHAPMRQWL